MDLSSLSGPIGGGVSVIVVSWLLSRVRSCAIPREDGKKVIRYHTTYACIGWAGIVFFVFCSTLCFLSQDSPRAKLVCISLFGGFALLSALMVLFHRRCSLVYNADTIRYTPLYGKPCVFTWSDVESVRFSDIGDWWRLDLRDRGTVRVGTFMNGASEFVQTLATKTRLQIPHVPQPHPTPRASCDS